MTRIERRVFRNCTLLGAFITLLVLLLDRWGALRTPENWMYDLRARYCQQFNSAPTDRLVHLDIDDNALQTIGWWPWPRAKMAEIIDELHRAGAAAMAMDVLFTEPQPPEFDVITVDGERRIREEVDNDRRLAESIKRAGVMLVPASLSFERAVHSPLYKTTLEILRTDLEANEKTVLEQVRAKGFDQPDLDARFPEYFLPARRDAMLVQLKIALRDHPGDIESARKQLLPHTDMRMKTPVTRVFDEQLKYIMAQENLKAHLPPLPKGSPALIQSEFLLAPIPEFCAAAGTTAFVNYTTNRDGVLRSVQLLVECDGKVYPQMGLALAATMLGADLNEITFDDQRVQIPRSDGSRIVIPVHTAYSEITQSELPMTIDIPWFGGKDWETMYDFPAHKRTMQHYTIQQVWNVCETRQKIIRNNANLDAALLKIRSTTGAKLAAILPDDDVAGREKLIDVALRESDDLVKQYKDIPKAQLTADDYSFLDAVAILSPLREENRKLSLQLDRYRTELSNQMRGRAVLIGFTATGRQDVTPTSIHATCPGVVAHGVIFNAIMTERFWKRAPHSMTIFIVIALGMAAALIAGKFTPFPAFVIVSILGIGYVLLNTLWLFGTKALLVDLFVPQFALATVWGGCSLTRIMIETAERDRITRRFRSYVDPALVNYVLEHPDDVLFAGARRDLTVCFSDLAGFTTLSERLGEAAVPLLNEIMNTLVPIIGSKNGYVNKFLGDGIMFFFGAPEPNTSHVAAAVETAIEMQKAMVDLNADLTRRSLPNVAVRLGICSGLMIVGDAGSADRCDYTVIGNLVNLAARLESANKQIGTGILINDQANQSLEDRFITRPIGSLQVIGRSEGVLTYEVLGRPSEVDQNLVKLTTEMVDSFQKREFAVALERAKALDTHYGPSKLTSLYRKLCEQYIKEPPDGSFNGTIVLTEK